MSSLGYWVGLTLALLAAAGALALASRRINPGQASRTAWRLTLRPLTLDLSPWTLDAAFRYWPSSVHSVLADWGPIGRRLSLWLHLTIDLVLPPAYAVSLSLAIARAAAPLHMNASVLTLFRWLPVAAAALDWLENAVIIMLSRPGSHPSPGLATTVWLASASKWLFLSLSISALVICWDADLNTTLAGWGVPEVRLAPWQSFYTATAGGSAAILGLFYVAQSVQGQRPVRPEHQAGRQHVALTSTFTTVMILLISLSALWGEQSARAFGAISIVLMAAYTVLSLWHQRYVGKTLRFQRWRRGRVAGAVVAVAIIAVGGVGAIEESRTGLILIATGIMVCFALWAITALALLYPLPEAAPRNARSR